MPRATDGQVTWAYPTPYPSTGELITAAWGTDMFTETAAMLQDSLSRSGNGAMLEQLRVTDFATVGATKPHYSFSSQTTMGMRRAGLNDLRFGLDTDVLRLNKVDGDNSIQIFSSNLAQWVPVLTEGVDATVSGTWMFSEQVTFNNGILVSPGSNALIYSPTQIRGDVTMRTDVDGGGGEVVQLKFSSYQSAANTFAGHISPGSARGGTSKSSTSVLEVNGVGPSNGNFSFTHLRFTNTSKVSSFVEDTVGIGGSLSLSNFYRDDGRLDTAAMPSIEFRSSANAPYFKIGQNGDGTALGRLELRRTVGGSPGALVMHHSLLSPDTIFTDDVQFSSLPTVPSLTAAASSPSTNYDAVGYQFPRYWPLVPSRSAWVGRGDVSVDPRDPIQYSASVIAVGSGDVLNIRSDPQQGLWCILMAPSGSGLVDAKAGVTLKLMDGDNDSSPTITGFTLSDGAVVNLYWADINDDGLAETVYVYGTGINPA